MIEHLYRLDELPIRATANIPRVRGHVDTLLPQADGTLLVSGWMILIDRPLDHIEVHLDGKHSCKLPLEERTDIAAFYRGSIMQRSAGFVSGYH